MKNIREVLESKDPVGYLRELHSRGELSKLEPTLQLLEMKIPRGAPRHKNNLTHSIQVLENAINMESSPDLVLRTAALFHDIGKPATRRFGEGKVTFYNHEVVGAKMVRTILPNHGYSAAEISEVSTLVRYHMRAYGFGSNWTDSAVRRIIREVGSVEQLNRLIIVFKSDLTTKNPAKYGRISRNLAELERQVDLVQQKDERAKLRPALNGLEVAEILGIAPGKELKKYMQFLNSDEGIALSREQAVIAIRELD